VLRRARPFHARGNFSVELGFFIIVRPTAAILALAWNARDVHKSLISPFRGKMRQAERESLSLPFRPPRKSLSALVRALLFFRTRSISRQIFEVAAMK